jgi:hypothetical protein
MSKKQECEDIWSLWGKGWICVPTAPDNTEDRFPTELGRYLVSHFPGLEKNYGRLCEAGLGPYSFFRSSFSRTEENRKLLVYVDFRDPLSPGDNGLILLPDTAGIVGNKEDDQETDWQVIEKSANFILENRRIIPGPIFVPPLGYGEDRMEEEDAIDDLMGALIEAQDVYVIHGINIPGEEEKEEEEQIEEEEVKPTPPPGFGSPKEEKEDEQAEPVPSHGSMIQDEFETIEVRKP